jgi:two-component system OmpR family response regulator
MKHVLVVDDDPSIRDVIGSYLREQNFEVSAVSDGSGMTQVLADKPVDLIILDLKLADEDGLDLMRGLGGRPQVPVILLTGHARDEADRIIGLELGADDYMLKPFALRELSRVCARYCGDRTRRCSERPRRKSVSATGSRDGSSTRKRIR